MKISAFAKGLGDEKRKVILQRMLKSYRKYKDDSNTIHLNSGQHDFDMGVKDASKQAKKQI